MSASTVTCIIPVFNGERHLAEAMQSVLDQTHPASEILAIDDGSTDGSSGVIARYDGRVRYLRKERGGPASARNVRIEFPEGNDCIIESELTDKFPFELLERHQAVELIAAVSMETKSKHKIKLLWDDDRRSNNEKIVYATI